MPALLKPLVLAAAAAAALGALPAQAADCSAARGCAAKFCHIENDIAAAQAQNNTRREAGLRKALAEARAARPTRAKQLEKIRRRFEVPEDHEIICGRNAVAEAARAGVPMSAAYDIEEASRGAVSSADAGAVALTPCPCDTGAGIMMRVGCQDRGGAGRRSRHVHTTCIPRGNATRDEACSASARGACGLVGGSADPTSFVYATLVWCCIAMSAVQ